MLFLLVGIAGKASEIAKKIYETLRNTAALGVIGKTGKALAKSSYDAVKDAMAATSAKTGEREKYTTEKVAHVARGTSGTAKMQQLPKRRSLELQLLRTQKKL